MNQQPTATTTSRRRIAATAVAGIIATIAGASSASAAPIEAGRYSESGSVGVDWCAGIDLIYSWTVSGTYSLVESGRDGLPRFREGARGTEQYTNVDTGRSVTVVWTNNSRDLAVTDNGDGTVTYLVQASGGERWYDAEGTFQLANPGLVRYEVKVDSFGNGEFLGLVKGSTGRNDTAGRDFCTDIATFTS